MSFAGLLNHKCSIYHAVETKSSPGYGISGAPRYGYADSPDIENVPCHFSIGGSSRKTVQKEPNQNYEVSIKLALPKDTDIRLNDKIVDLDMGYEYTAEIALNIRGHHKYVMLHRTGRQIAL